MHVHQTDPLPGSVEHLHGVRWPPPMTALGRERHEHERRLADFRAALTPRELVAFTVGYHLGQGGSMPNDRLLDELRRRLGDDRATLCRRCGTRLPPPTRPGRGRPPVNCAACRGKLTQ